MTMGERIKMLRKEKGLTQEQLGAMLGVQKAAIWKYEKGNVANIKRSTIQKMSEIFDVSPNYLMCYSEKRKDEPPSHEELPANARELVSLFSKIPEEKQQMVLNMIRSALDSIE